MLLAADNGRIDLRFERPLAFRDVFEMTRCGVELLASDANRLDCGRQVFQILCGDLSKLPTARKAQDFAEPILFG